MANSTLGITFGGLADAEDSRRRLGEVSRRTDIAERGIQFQEDQATRQEAAKGQAAALKNIEQLTALAVKLRASGKPEGEPQINMFRQRVAKVAEAFGMSPDDFTAVFDAELLASQTSEEEARGEARATVAGVKTTAEALDVETEDVARAQGLLPETTTTLTPSQIRDFGLPVGTIAQEESSGKLSILQSPEGSDLEVINSFDAQGRRVVEIWDMAGGRPQKIQEVNRGFSTQIQPQEFPSAVQKKEFVELRDQQINTQQFVDNARDLQARIKNKPELIGTPGALSRAVSSITAQIEGLAKVSGVSSDPGVSDVSRYDQYIKDNFPELAGAATGAAQARSTLVGLAYAAALASGQKGRSVSDRDVKLFMQRIGADIGNPRVMNSVLDNIVSEMISNFGTRARIIAKDKAGDFELLDPGFDGGGGIDIPPPPPGFEVF